MVVRYSTIDILLVPVVRHFVVVTRFYNCLLMAVPNVTYNKGTMYYIVVSLQVHQ